MARMIHMEFTREFMKAIQEELKRIGVTMELEGGEGTFNIQDIGDSKVTLTVIIESNTIIDKQRMRMISYSNGSEIGDNADVSG